MYYWVLNYYFNINDSQAHHWDENKIIKILINSCAVSKQIKIIKIINNSIEINLFILYYYLLK